MEKQSHPGGLEMKQEFRDENGILFRKVGHLTYRNSIDKLRIIKHLSAEYFVEVEEDLKDE
jgi:hypothetical protein